MAFKKIVQKTYIKKTYNKNGQQQKNTTVSLQLRLCVENLKNDKGIKINELNSLEFKSLIGSCCAKLIDFRSFYCIDDFCYLELMWSE